MSLKNQLIEQLIKINNRINSGRYITNVKKEELLATKFLNQNSHNSGLSQDRWHYFSMIKMNNTYLEMSDPSYATRGFGNMLTGYCFILWIILTYQLFTIVTVSRVEVFLAVFVFFVLCSLFFVLIPLCLGFRYDNYHYTHYPIRFNRKNRKVYFMDKNGDFHSEDWGKVLFYITQEGSERWDDMSASFELRAAIVDEQGIIHHIAGIGTPVPKEFLVEAQFRMITTYMNIGPELLYPAYKEGLEYNETELMARMTFCNDIDGKKESPAFSRYRVNMRNYGGRFWHLVSWIVLRVPLLMIGRIIGMKTCTVPVWPEWIESENKIAQNDKYVVDARINEFYHYNVWKRKIEVKKKFPSGEKL